MRLKDRGDIGMREIRGAYITYPPIHVHATVDRVQAASPFIGKGRDDLLRPLWIAADAGASATMRGSDGAYRMNGK
jgi:hypothetical protein